MASLKNRTGLLLSVLGLLALAACGGQPHLKLTDDKAPPPPELKTEFTQDSYIKVANQLRVAGDYNQALGFYQRAQAANPQDYRAFKGIGLTLLSMGATENALRSLAHAAVLNPEDEEVRAGLAKAELAAGQAQEARKEFLWLVAKAPRNSGYYNGLAVTCDLLGDHKQAQANYSMAITLAPDNRDLRSNLALSFAFDGNFDAAEEILSDMQDSPRGRLNLALVYGLAGERGKAQATAMHDLSQKDAERNLKSYDRLRHLPSKEQAAVILLGHPLPPQTNIDDQAIIAQ